MPRVIIGSPLFNHAKDFPEAIESILNQTYTDFALVLVDDCSTDATPDIAREYVALDARVSYRRNTERLGLIGNSHESFNAARARHPDAEYFAWASDHDLWHPRWLQQLVDTLDAHPEVVLAYPLNRRIGPSGEILRRKPWSFDTFGMTGTWSRLRLGIRKMSAGNMVYGLYRIGALEKAGVYRRVLVPDRLLQRHRHLADPQDLPHVARGGVPEIDHDVRVNVRDLRAAVPEVEWVVIRRFHAARCLGALVDPAFEDVDLRRRELFASPRRRHALLDIRVRDATDQLGKRRACQGRVAVVEAELGFALLLVGTVALEAVVGEDRADVAVEADGVRICLAVRCRRADQREHQEYRNPANHRGPVPAYPKTSTSGVPSDTRNAKPSRP